MDIIEKAEEFAKKEYAKHDPMHQWGHIQNVMNRALEIAKNFEDVDYEALKLAIIFHDIDYRSYGAHVDASAEAAGRFLSENNYPRERIDKIKEIMLDHSTPHREKRGDAKSLEGKIIYDADKSTILDKAMSEKYYPKLYLEETRRIVTRDASPYLQWRRERRERDDF